MRCRPEIDYMVKIGNDVENKKRKLRLSLRKKKWKMYQAKQEIEKDNIMIIAELGFLICSDKIANLPCACPRKS